MSRNDSMRPPETAGRLLPSVETATMDKTGDYAGFDRSDPTGRIAGKHQMIG